MLGRTRSRIRDFAEDTGISQGAKAGRRWALLFFGVACAAVLLWVVGGQLLGDFRTPSGAKEILRSAQDPASYRYESQMVRRVTLEGTKVETDALRSFAVNLRTNSFQGRLIHVFPEQLRVSSDGSTTIFKYPDQEWQKADAPISAADVAAPSPKTIAELDPKVIGDKDVLRGRRAWQITFQPDTAFYQQLFLTDAFARSGSEAEAIAAGKVTPRWAYVKVIRGDRAMLLLDVQFTIDTPERPEYRFLILYSDFDDPALDHFTLGGQS